jgi:1-acyl-sn-glycerol-3-phosphate acyltransferase
VVKNRFLSQAVLLFCMAVGVLWTVMVGIVTILSFVFSERWGHFFHRLWAKGVCWLVGIHVETYFDASLPQGTGYLLAPNHQSLWDIPVIASLPINFKWISKREVGRIPVVGWAMKAQGSFFVDRRRTGQDINVLREVEAGLRAGACVLIFPEGTRTRTGELLPFKRGAFRAAENTGAPLVPVAISGTYAIAPPYKLPVRRGHRVQVRIGPPIQVPRHGDIAQASEVFRAELLRLLQENGRNVV